jgi:soluble lytic murein transglycosylase-like protein
MAGPSNLPWEEAKSHAALYMERDKATTKEQQNALASKEHRAFAREAVAENPAMALPIAAAIPLYQGAKALGVTASRSDPSIAQAVEGLRGVGEGLVDAVTPPWEQAKAIANKFSQTITETVPKAVKSLLPWQEASQASEKARQGGSTGSWEINAPSSVKQANITESFTKKLEKVESGGNPDAKNPNSSATGLHQFLSDTWKETVKQMGKNYTLEDRKDPVKSREVFQFFTQKNVERAITDLGRPPVEHELYMYHLLGRNGAGDILQAAPDKPAVEFVSLKQAKANKNIFYNDKGKSRTVNEVLTTFRKKFEDG